MNHGAEILTEYPLFVDHAGRLPLHANRDISPSGYWDHPVEWIPPEKKQNMHPICSFDFEVLG